MDLFDFFEDFECENENSNNNSSTPNYPDFLPCFHEKNWFFDKKYDESTPLGSISETDLYRACSLFDSQKIQESLEIFEKIYKSTKNNRFHEIMLIDSILQCYIKIPIAQFNQTNALCYLNAFESLLVDFGDQLQFLRTKCQILSRCRKSDDQELIDTICLLCSISDLPDNWLYFLETSKNDKNVELAILVRCLLSFEHQIGHSNGFVKSKLERKVQDLKSKIELLGADDLKIASLKSSLAYHYHHHHRSNDSSETIFRAHDSRAKNQFIPKPEQAEIIEKFKSRFSVLLLK